MAASTQILLDTDSKTVVKCLYIDAAGAEEAAVLKVNTATLKGRVWTLTVNVAPFPENTQKPTYIVGERFTTDTGNIGWITAYSRTAGANTATLTVVGDNGAFNATSTVNLTTASTNTAINVNSVANSTGIVSIAGINFAVGGNGIVQIQWVGSTNADAVILAGTGYMGKNNLPVPFINNAAAANGNINISTFNIDANSGYSVILELHKTQGFSARTGY